jgi:hypothetical protein
MSHTTHRYTGPTTIYGLQHGATCTLLPRKGPCGMVLITAHGRQWNVPRSQLERDSPLYGKRRRGLRDRVGRG